MIDQIILHVGMPKTGSTSLQQNLRGYDDGVARYARSGGPNHSILLNTVFSDRPEDYFQHVINGRTAAQVERMKSSMLESLEQEISCSSHARLVFSGEVIYLLGQVGLARMREYLLRYAKSVCVFGYARSPCEATNSLFQQSLRRGGRGALDLPNASYRLVFQPFIDVFGAENVEIAKYDRDGFPDGSVVRDFCQRFGLDAPIMEEPANQGMSTTAAKFLVHFNRTMPTASGRPELMSARRRLAALIEAHFAGDSFRLPRNVLLAVQDPEDIQWLYNTTRIDFRFDIQADNECDRDNSVEACLENLDHFDPDEIHGLKALLEKEGAAFRDTDAVTELLSHLFYEILLPPAEVQRSIRRILHRYLKSQTIDGSDTKAMEDITRFFWPNTLKDFKVQLATALKSREQNDRD